jgi:hypothetical protein
LGDFHELRFEDLGADPAKVIADIYDGLGLSGKTETLDAVGDYVEGQGEYQKNAFQLSSAQQEQIKERWGYAVDRWGYGR